MVMEFRLMENRWGWLEFCEKKMSSLLGSVYIANPGQSQKNFSFWGARRIRGHL